MLGERKGVHFRYYESDLFVIGATGGQLRRITRSQDVTAVAPGPTAGPSIARHQDPATRPLTYSLWLIGADGGNSRRLVDREEGQLDYPGIMVAGRQQNRLYALQRYAA